MRIKFKVNGMTCAACSARVEKTAQQIEGVHSAEVNLLAGTMVVTVDSEDIAKSVISAVNAAGYETSLYGQKAETSSSTQDTALSQMKIRIIGSAVCLLTLMYFTMGYMVGLPLPKWYVGPENAMVAVLLQLLLTIPPVILNNIYYRRGLKALWRRSPNMDTLIAVGSGAALLYGIVALFRMAYAVGHGQWEIVDHYSKNLYFESAAMILTLITLGKFLETRAKGKTGDAIRQLMDLSPKTAIVLRDNTERTIPVEEVRIGDIVIVKAGASIPVDGTVLSGRASVDQSALTGESVPVEKGIGDKVSAATTNTEGFLQIRADKVGDDTTLSQIISMVEEAGGSKAPIARLADKIAGIFVPVVMAISLASFIVWMILGKDLEFSLNIAIAILVISCPCALGLATPVAIMVGTGRGARMGVLFKTAEALEHLQKVDTVVLDKTGTLTQGKPAVSDILPAGDESFLLQVAASLEAKSEHPFAKAILEHALSVELLPVDDFQTLPGQGVCGIIDNRKYYGGNRNLMNSLGIQVPEYLELSEEGKTPLYFADSERYLGAIAATDILKADSVEAVKRMQQLHMDVVMLTGDNSLTAQAIANQAGITHVIAEVLPGDKASVISDLQNSGRRVLMVGDGINDAPALVTADVGMAIGAGTDIAIESADIVLMNSSLTSVSDAIELSKATVRNIRGNLFWAFFYNILGIPIAAGALYSFDVLLSPMIGAAAMSLSSVFVVTNALRLRFFSSKQKKAERKADMIQEVKQMETIIKVEGMMCPHCKARVESVCKSFDGVKDAVVDLQLKQVTVIGDTDLAALKKAIVDAGYEVLS